MGIYKDIQEKCVDELKEIFQDDFNRPITFNDTLEMKYLERVILEALRLYPPVPMIARKVNEDVKLGTLLVHFSISFIPPLISLIHRKLSCIQVCEMTLPRVLFFRLALADFHL